jgi:hypothetical protein
MTMAMTFTRQTMTIQNKLHGDIVVIGYISGGIAIAKLGRRWNIYHHASGICISNRLTRPTLIDAKGITAKLLALPIEWEKPEADVMESISEHATAIREIAK